MNYNVTRHTLLFIAGSIWILAGANILRIGILSWLSDTNDWIYKTGVAALVFLFFFRLIFRKLLSKHTQRIIQKKEKSCPFSFFDLRGWMVMFVMITFGVVIRKLGLMPAVFISVFYTGLSTALILTGFLFLRQGYKVKKGRYQI